MAHFAIFPTPIGSCGIAWTADSVIGTRLPDKTPNKTADYMTARFAATQLAPPIFIRSAVSAITSLLEGERASLSFIKCDFRLIEPFAQRVYTATRAVQVGEVTTYGEIAANLGNRQWARQVGRALGQNPFPIIVPCHRVVGASGKLTGFSAPGGVATKLKMLSVEQAQMGGYGGLFEDLPMMLKPNEIPDER